MELTPRYNYFCAHLILLFVQDFTMDQDLEKAIREFYEEKKPIAACCISPILVAKALGKNVGGPGCVVTVGGDSAVEDSIKALGNDVAQAKVTEAFVDAKNRVVTTGAYMFRNPQPHEVYQGIGEMINEMIKLSRTTSSSSKEVDWDFQDYYALKIKKIDPKDWSFIKKETQAKIEEEKRKAKM